MKTFAKLLALLLASVLCTTGVSAGVIVTDSAGVTYESHKIDDRRLVRYSPDKPEKEFTISDTSVEPYSFEGAKNLEKITITDGVFYIGEYAFKDCTSLKEVVIDKTWGGVVIPKNAFDGCTSLDPAVIEELCWEKPFTDIFPQDWYYNAVQFVHQNGLMNGMSDSKFAPDTGMTRAMFVTVLGRLAGVTDVKEVVNKDGTPCIEWRLANGQWGGIAIAQTFTDVEEGQWYTDYVKWAAANGILQGYGDGTFGVDDKVTIEQAAVILYRYQAAQESPAYDMEGDYTDTDEISAWAMDAMRWITATDIYDGYDGGQLRPKQNAARALVAEMLYNYVQMNPLTAEKAAEKLKNTLIIAYESYYDAEFIPTEEETSESGGQAWDRYQISSLSETSVVSETEEFYKIPYVWDFYVNKYTEKVYVYYNGIDPFFMEYNPLTFGLGFAG